MRKRCGNLREAQPSLLRKTKSRAEKRGRNGKRNPKGDVDLPGIISVRRNIYGRETSGIDERTGRRGGRSRKFSKK